MPALTPLCIRSSYLLIACLPVIVFVFGDQLIVQQGNLSITWSAAGALDAPAEAAGRYVFYGTFLLFSVIAISAIATALVDLTHYYSGNDLFRLLIVALVLVVIVILVNLLPGPRTCWLAGRDLFDKMFKDACVSSCAPDSGIWSCACAKTLEKTFSAILRASNLLTAGAAGLAVVGTISCLGLKCNNGQEPVTKELLALQSKRLSLYLYLSSAILVGGILVIYGWLHWPDFFFVGDQSGYERLTTALLLYYGVNYSLIIFSFYVPVALILDDRAAELPLTPSEPSTLFAGLPDIFRTALALASPFLTAATGSIISRLTT